MYARLRGLSRYLKRTVYPSVSGRKVPTANEAADIPMLCYPIFMLDAFGHSLNVADGSTVSFFGFLYPTRMVVVRLSDGNVWVWSPVAITEVLASADRPVLHEIRFWVGRLSSCLLLTASAQRLT